MQNVASGGRFAGLYLGQDAADLVNDPVELIGEVFRQVFQRGQDGVKGRYLVHDLVLETGHIIGDSLFKGTEFHKGTAPIADA